MNCLSCRQHLEPFLDDELSVNENVAVLEHVTACTPCQDIFSVERRIREALRNSLAKETCPPETGVRLLAAVRGEARGAWKRKWRLLVVPVAAAAAIMLLVRLFDGGFGPNVPPDPQPGQRVTFASDRKHDHSMHGELLAWAGARYDELVNGLPKGQVLTKASLSSVLAPGRLVTPVDEFELDVKAELGSDFKLPPRFVEGGRIVGGELLSWHEGWVPQVIVEYGNRELALYEISGCQAKKLGRAITKLMASLHPVESDQGRQVSISACRGCDAILVLRNNRAYILISRHGRDWDDDWMVQRARKLLD